MNCGEILDQADAEAVDALWDRLAKERDAEMDVNPSTVLNARDELQNLILQYQA